MPAFGRVGRWTKLKGRLGLPASGGVKSNRPDDQAAIMAAEAEAVGDGPANAGLAGGVGDVIQVAGRIGSLVVDGGMNDAGLDGQGGSDQLDAAASAQQMAEHALGTADR